MRALVQVARSIIKLILRSLLRGNSLLVEGKRETSTRQLADTQGSIGDSYAYDAWGNNAGVVGGTPNSFRYNGQSLEGNGLYFLRARFMNPSTGRFLNHGPLMGYEDDPITLHRYLYAGVNPISNVDPGGEEFSMGGMMTSMSISTTVRGVSSDVYSQVLDNVSNAFGVDFSMEGIAASAFNKTTGLNMTADQIRAAEFAFAAFHVGKYIGKFLGGFKKAKRALRTQASGVQGALGAIDDGPMCFVAGTLISMADGSLKPIEKVKAGDQVLSRDEKTGKTGVKSVEATSIKQASATLVFTFSNGEKIETTKEHPFYVEGKGFVEAKNLAIGNSIVTRAGPALRVLDIQIKLQPATVYNFSVEDYHTYFVGNASLWVHNAKSCVLDKNLGGTGGDNMAAHHLIPGKLEDMPIIQRAQRAGWDIDANLNGMHLPSDWDLSRKLNLPLHNTRHEAYTDMVRERLERIDHGSLSDVQLMSALDDVSDFYRQFLRDLGGGVRVPNAR